MKTWRAGPGTQGFASRLRQTRSATVLTRAEPWREKSPKGDFSLLFSVQANALKVPITEPVALIGVQALDVPLLLAQSSLTLAAAAGCGGSSRE